ncbi:hypothetical protein KP509_14G062000 [Ceratopteris richardii]|uniref:PPM-type phosphatase domain-containing protein n=1 Tax=Ceratopteris richardii TaxID=49495 RepID=A0A8T2TDF4_CERRI|nr:hypothetical protein KP509_14G062000 [Ceratopteris richardii]
MDSNQGAEDDSLHIAETISGIPLLHVRKASLKSDELRFDADGTPSQESTGNEDTRVQRLDAEDDRATKILTGEHYLACKAAILRSIEGDVCNGSALTLKEVCPFTCPPSGKVCICGRRREMEDTAITIPFCMKIPKCLAAERPQNDAIFSDLHFYAVYDGQGGSQPERVHETRRIEAAGGYVIAWNGYRITALLALSRAIGDGYLKRYVISEPDVVHLERSDEDEFLILASDGLWDVIDNETACDVARVCFASTRGGKTRSASKGDDIASATAEATLVKLACGKGSQDMEDGATREYYCFSMVCFNIRRWSKRLQMFI